MPTTAEAALATAAAAAAPGLSDTITGPEFVAAPPAEAPMAPSSEGDAPCNPPEASEAAGLRPEERKTKVRRLRGTPHTHTLPWQGPPPLSNSHQKMCQFKKG